LKNDLILNIIFIITELIRKIIVEKFFKRKIVYLKIRGGR